MTNKVTPDNIKALYERISPQLVPAGGTTGQVLSKSADTDYSLQWTDMASGIGDVEGLMLLASPDSGDIEADGLYIQDGNAVFGLADIQAAAEDIAAKGEDSLLYPRYHGYLTGDRRFKVRFTENNTTGLYDVRLIGINHDDRSDGSGKAAFTFQFVNLLNMPYTFGNTRYWKTCTLRTTMNEGDIWSSFTEDLQGAMASVSKRTSTNSSINNSIETTDDRVFLASVSEICDADTYQFLIDKYPSNFAWIADEGAQYEFWRGSLFDAANPGLVAGCQGTPDTAVKWWLRTTHPYIGSNSMHIICVTGSGYTYSSDMYTSTLYLRPCFCI